MRILGIDIGATSIKAVEFESAFRRYEVHEYHEHPLIPGEDPMQALAAMIAKLHKKPDRVAIALKTGEVTFRNLQLPTRERKAIQAGVGFELDDELPFPLEDTAYDYSILSQGKQAGTHLHVAATLKTTLERTLEALSGVGIDPDLVTTEAWALRGFFNATKTTNPSDGPLLLAQIGHEKTLLYAHWHGTPIIAREIPWGGRDLTEAISQHYQISLQEAEQAKRDNGFVIPASQTQGDISREQLEFSVTLLNPLEKLMAELKRATLTVKNLSHHSVSAIYLSGGTSLLPGLARVTEETQLIPVKPLQSLSALTPSGVIYSESSDATFLVAASLALTQVGADKITPINFRKGPYAKQGRTREINFTTLKKPMAAAAAILVCLLTSLVIQSSVYESRLKDIDVQLERNVKNFFGQVSGSAIRTYLADTSALKAHVTKDLNKQRELNRLFTPNPHSPLDFLKSISASVSKDTVVDMVQYQVGAAPGSSFLEATAPSASLSFLMTNPQTADRLVTSLSQKLSGMQKGKPEEVTLPDGVSKRWKVTLTGKPTEDSYGK